MKGFMVTIFGQRDREPDRSMGLILRRRVRTAEAVRFWGRYAKLVLEATPDRPLTVPDPKGDMIVWSVFG